MSFRLSSLECCLTLAFFAGVTFVSTGADGQGESRPRRSLELSETNNPEVLSRLNQLTEKKEGLKELEQEWDKAFQSLSLDNRAGAAALAPQYAPPRPASVPNKHIKDLLERRKNWMLTPDDLLPENSNDDWLSDSSSDSGRKNGNRNSLTQFSDALNRHEAAASKKADAKEDGMEDAFKAHGLSPDSTLSALQDDPALPTSVRNTARNLNSWLGTETAQGAMNAAEVRSSFDDFFGLGNSGLTKEQEKANKDYLEKYQSEVLGGIAFLPSSPAASPVLNPLLPAGSPLQPAYMGGLESTAPGLKPDSSSQHAMTFGSVLSPVTVPNLNANVLNQWNPQYSTPTPEPPKVTSPIFPTTEFPRRRF